MSFFSNFFSKPKAINPEQKDKVFKEEMQEEFGKFKEQEEKLEEKIEYVPDYMVNKKLEKVDYYNIQKQIVQLEREKKYFSEQITRLGTMAVSDEKKEEARQAIQKEIDRLEKKAAKLKEKKNELGTIDGAADFDEKIKDLDAYKTKLSREENLTNDEKKKLKEALDVEYEMKNQMSADQFKKLIDDLLKRLGSGNFRKFVQKNCIFNLDYSKKGIVLDKQIDKINITIGGQSLYEEGLAKIKDELGNIRKTTYLRPDRVAFLLGKSIGCILEEPDNWDKIAPKIKITEEGGESSWVDFCGLCLTLPNRAEEMSKDAYAEFLKRLDGIKDREIKISKFEEKNNPEIALDLKIDGLEDWEDAKHFWRGASKSGFINNIIFPLKFLYGMTRGKYKKYWWAKQRLFPETNYIYKALAELEDKEISSITLRNAPIAERDGLMRNLVGNGKEIVSREKAFMLKCMVYAAAKTSDLISWRIDTVLQATDEEYQKTHGEMITKESHDFLDRAHRISQVNGKRTGTKVIEYKKVKPGEAYRIFNHEKNIYETRIAGETVYVRKDREEYQYEVLEELNKTSIRKASSIAQEQFEQMMEELVNPINPNRRYSDKTYCGKISDNLPADFVNHLLKSINNRGEIRSLDPDALGAMALIISGEVITEAFLNLGKPEKEALTHKLGVPDPGNRRMVSGEHAKPIISNLYLHYKDIFLQDDKLRSYINYFLKGKHIQTDSNGNLSRIAPGDDFKTKIFTDHSKLKRADILLEQYDEWQYDETSDPYEQDELDEEGKPILDDTGKPKKEKVDNTWNDQRDDFYTDRSTEEAVENLESIEKAIELYKQLIKERVEASDLSQEVQKIILRLTFENKNYTNEMYILNDVFEQVRQKLPLDAIEPIIKKLENAFIGIRPLRKEYIRQKFFLNGLFAGEYEESIDLDTVRAELKEKLEKDVKDKFNTDSNYKYQILKEYKKELDKVEKDPKKIKAIEKKAKEKEIDKLLLKKLAEKYDSDIKKINECILDLDKNKKTAEEIMEELKKIKGKDNKSFIPESELKRLDDLKNKGVRQKDINRQVARILKTALANLEFQIAKA